MGKWGWAITAPMMCPVLAPLCASLLDSLENTLLGRRWFDPEIAYKIEEDGLRLYVAMITAAHF